MGVVEAWDACRIEARFLPMLTESSAPRSSVPFLSWRAGHPPRAAGAGPALGPSHRSPTRKGPHLLHSGLPRPPGAALGQAKFKA